MKKKVLGFIVAIAAIASGTIYAKSTSNDKQNNQQTECCLPAPGNKKADRGPKFNPFNGIQLSDDQQQRLKVLREGLGPVKLTPEQKAKLKEENKGLTSEQKKQKKAERKAKKAEAKKNYLNGVKEILTPDQYVIFLENVYLYSPEPGKGMGQKDGKMKGKKEFKGGKDKKGDKGTARKGHKKGDKNAMAKKGQKKDKNNKKA